MDNRGCLYLCSLNCNDLPGKIRELSEFAKENNFNLILLQEIHLNQSKSFKISNNTILLINYINPNSIKILEEKQSVSEII